MTDHAAASPSSASMWLNCPASVTQAKGKTRPSSIYAMEGTAAHLIAHQIIEGELFPPGKITVEGREFIVGLPMLRALNPYIDLIQHLQGQTQDWHCERRVYVDGPNGVVWGTTDFASLYADIVDIVDLKYGKGVAVKPDSPQLKIYAIAAIKTLWPGRIVSRINLTVAQPRIDPVPQTVTLSIEDLAQWHFGELVPAIERIKQGSEIEKYGAWCRWCVRRNECKAFNNHKNSSAADIFDDGVDMVE